MTNDPTELIIQVKLTSPLLNKTYMKEAFTNVLFTHLEEDTGIEIEIDKCWERVWVPFND